jgi:hypothetical protein
MINSGSNIIIGQAGDNSGCKVGLKEIGIVVRQLEGNITNFFMRIAIFRTW